jgi:hypothetical protein
MCIVSRNTSNFTNIGVGGNFSCEESLRKVFVSIETQK